MTMVLPPSPYDVIDTDRYLCSSTAAAVYGGEIDSARRRLPLNLHRSTSYSSLSSSPAYCSNNDSQSDRVNFDEMADELRPDNDPNQPSSSSMDPAANENWLRLRLGSSDDQSSSQDMRRGGLVELDLLPAITSSSHQRQQQVIRSNTRPQGFFPMPEFRAPPQRPVALLQRIPAPEINWALMRPSNIMMTEQQHQLQQIGSHYYYMANHPASMSPNFFPRPNSGASQMGLNGGGGGDGASSSNGMRIIRPPRRPHVGIWFMLQASQNQVTESFLPQIPKSYLRIKNGRMTVRLLMKYLVQKLGLESESEVEIRCRGQELQPILTLQHVRDNIWCTRRDMQLTLLTESTSSSTTLPSAVDSHIMILHYGRPLLSATATAATTATATSSGPIF